MPRQGDYQIDSRDAQDYARAVEDMYDVMIVVELRPSSSRVSGHWLICATAYQAKEDGPVPVFRGEEARFPGAHHASFGGAMLWACQKLESRLQAAVALKQLPLPLAFE